MRVLPACLLAMACAAASATERMEAYGYAAPITLVPGDALYALPLPAGVYRHTATADLSDLRVFNGDGEAVAHALRVPKMPDKAAPVAAKLPIFPVRAGKGEVSTDGLDVEVRRDGAVVRVRPARSAGSTPIVAWLVDASGFDSPIEALDLTIAASADVVARVRVDVSDDLRRWSRAAEDAPVVQARFAGERLEQLRVPVGGVRGKYLRLTDVRGTLSFALEGVRAIAPAQEGGRTLESVSLAASAPVDRAWEYDTGGHFPVERITVSVREDNTVLPFELDARTDAKQPWRPIARGVAYRLTQDGVTVSNTEVPVAFGRDRHLRLRVGGSMPLPTAGPTIELRWLPADLVFAARGAPPFTLAYGLAGAPATALAIQSLVPGHGGPDAMQPKPAQAGAERALAGAGALRPAPDYRRWSLWAVLGVAVLVLGGMGLKLAREAGTPPA